MSNTAAAQAGARLAAWSRRTALLAGAIEDMNTAQIDTVAEWVLDLQRRAAERADTLARLNDPDLYEALTLLRKHRYGWCSAQELVTEAKSADVTVSDAMQHRLWHAGSCACPYFAEAGLVSADVEHIELGPVFARLHAALKANEVDTSGQHIIDEAEGIDVISGTRVLRFVEDQS